MDFPEIADLEIVELRQKIKELEQKLSEAERTLEQNGLVPAKTSEVEQLCIRELERYNELSKKSSLLTEDVKNVEVLVKTLQLARGKAPVEEKKKKKEEKPDIGKLLKLAEQGE